MEQIASVPLYTPEFQMMVIRHGTTQLNSDGRIRGWLNVPLSEEGRVDAQDMGKYLRNSPPDMIYTSDFDRAAETAKIISEATGTPIKETTEALRPWDLGDLAGQIASEVHPIISDYVTNRPDEKIPGGESFNTFKNRFLGKIQEITKDNPGKLVAIVTHHRGERLLDGWADAGQPEDFSVDPDAFLQRGIPPGSLRLQLLKS